MTDNPIEQAQAQDKSFMHVDTFIDDIYKPSDPDQLKRAKWILRFYRMPAADQLYFKPIVGDLKLFCDHDGKRWRVNGASRLGDIYLCENLEKGHGYDKRVCVNKVSGWSYEP